jgi:hypothetical protein
MTFVGKLPIAAFQPPAVRVDVSAVLAQFRARAWPL